MIQSKLNFAWLSTIWWHKKLAQVPKSQDLAIFVSTDRQIDWWTDHFTPCICIQGNMLVKIKGRLNFYYMLWCDTEESIESVDFTSRDGLDTPILYIIHYKMQIKLDLVTFHEPHPNKPKNEQRNHCRSLNQGVSKSKVSFPIRSCNSSLTQLFFYI